MAKITGMNPTTIEQFTVWEPRDASALVWIPMAWATAAKVAWDHFAVRLYRGKLPELYRRVLLTGELPVSLSLEVLEQLPSWSLE